MSRSRPASSLIASEDPASLDEVGRTDHVTAPDESSDKANRWWANPWTVTIIGGLIVAIVSGVAVPQILSATSAAHSSRPSIALTIQNDRSYGVWTRSSPNGQFATQSAKPANAVQWLRQGTTVHAACARPGGRYRVIVNGIPQVWSWWSS